MSKRLVSTNWGAVGVDTQPIVTQRTWTLAPGDTTGWLYRPTQTLTGYGSSTGVLQTGNREGGRLQYDVNGRLTTVEAPLTGTQALVRTNPAGATAPAPATASVNTTGGALLTLATYSLRLVREHHGRCRAPSGAAPGRTYVRVLTTSSPFAVNVYRGGCGTNPLTTTLDVGPQAREAHAEGRSRLGRLVDRLEVRPLRSSDGRSINRPP